MKLISLSVSGYRQFADPMTLSFPDGLTGICGPNGVGKSKLLEAIGYALYGPRRVLPKGDAARDLASKGKPGALPIVKLELELRGQRYIIHRGASSASITAEHGDVLAETPSGVTKKATELLRLSADAFQGTFVAKQREVAGLQSMGPGERQRLVNRLIGISQAEKAVELARGLKGQRTEELNLVTARLGTPAKDEEARLKEHRRQLRLANEVLNTADAALAAANDAVSTQQQVVESIRGGAKLAGELRGQLDELNRHKTTLSGLLTTAISNRDAAMAAGEAADSAQALLDRTDAVPDEVSRHEDLKLLDQLREDLATAKGRAGELAEANGQRNGLQGQATGLREQIKQADNEIAAESQRLTIAHRSELEAADALASHEASLAAARSLGPEGRCPVCGQTYGDSFGAAEAHFGEEIENARQRQGAALAEVSELQARLKAAQERREALVSRLNDVSNAIGDLQDVPGELASAVRAAQSVEEEISGFGDDLAHEEYDSTVHERLMERLAERERTFADLDRLQPIADSRSAADLEVGRLQGELTAISDRRSKLERRLAAEQGKAARLIQAEQALTQLVAAATERDSEARAATGRVAAAATEASRAETDLSKALSVEGQIAQARRQAHIADRTDELLVRLLRDITDEARPLLSEMMDGWGSSLLGTRFRGVQLNDDYSIRADNGSGWHGLAHFSGGEQTVLAIMLRVAISLFCRERAGFDTGFLILDEVFGDQDEDHRVLLVEFLSEIRRHYHQVIIVNHVEDVTAMLDSIIDVRRISDHTSTAALRT